MNPVTLPLLLLISTGPIGATDLTARLSPINESSMARFGVFDPQTALLSAEKPTGVSKAPARDELHWARFEFGPASASRTIHVALSESDPTAPAIWIDANSNGDLTDDADQKWQPVKPADASAPSPAYETFFTLPTDDGPFAGRTVRVFRFTPAEATARKLTPLGIYASMPAGAQGELLIDSRKYAAVLLDRSATADFTYPNGRSSAMLLLLDANGDSNFGPTERFPIDRAFRLNDAWFEVDTIKGDGTEFKLKKAASPEEIAKRTAPPTTGDVAPAFTGPGLDGKPVNFPADYKGKLVLVDFWATWCMPCVAELPNVKAVHDKYHDKGLEVLGISFDKPGQADAVRKFAEARKLPWRHVYEGKFWATDIGQKWNIGSIPAAFLIDGDSGRVLAAGPAVRGEKLDATVGLEIKNKFRDAAP